MSRSVIYHIEEHTVFLRRLARKLLQSSEGVDDVVQDTMMVALRKGTDLWHRGWLSGILRNRAREHTRAKRRRRLAETKPRGAETHSMEPAEMLALEEMRKSVFDAAVQLAPELREVIFLRFFEGHAPRQVAAALELPIRVVRHRIERGLLVLRKELGREFDGRRAELRSGLIVIAYPLAGEVGSGVLAGVTVLKAIGALFLSACLVLGVLALSSNDASRSAATRGGAEGTTDASASREALRHGADTDALHGELEGRQDSREVSGSAELLGTIHDLSGRPVSGARVVLTVQPTGVPGAALQRRVARVADDGGYRFPGLPDCTVSELAATAPGHLSRRHAAVGVSLALGETHVVNMKLPRECTLRGVVRDGQGVALEGVVIIARAQGSASGQAGVARYETPTATSDARGRFVMGGMLPGESRLALGKDGYCVPLTMDTVFGFVPCTIDPDEGHAEMDLLMLRGVPVSGVVRGRDGEPAAGTTLKLRTLLPRHTFAPIDELTVKADSSGSFMFSGVRPGCQMELTSRADGHGSTPVSLRIPRSGELRGVEVVLHPFAQVSGTISATHTEDLIPGRRIDLKSLSGGVVRETRANGVGAYSFREVLAGSYVIEVPHAGGVRATPPSARYQVSLDWGEVRTRVRLTCQSMGDCSGLVLDSQRRPVSALEIRLVPVVGGGRSIRLIVDPDGKFVARGLLESEYKVFCGETRLGRIRAGERLKEFECPESVTDETTSIVLRVLRPDGTPVPTAAGISEEESGGHALAEQEFVALDGVARFPHLRGRRSMTRTWYVWDPRDERGQPINACPGEFVQMRFTEQEVVIKLKPGRTIAGRVVDEHGAPVRGVAVTARGGERFPRRPGRHLARHVKARSGIDGAFVIVGLEEGPWKLSFGTPHDEWLGEETMDVAAGVQDLRVVLRRGGAISGRTLDERGDPIPMCPVLFVGSVPNSADQRKVYGQSVCDEHGEFEIRGLPLGATGSVSVQPPVLDPGVLLSARSRVVVAGESGLEVILERGVYVRGRVEFPSDGKPSRASVTLRGKSLERSLTAWCTREQPEFRLGPIRAGPYQLRVTPRGRVGGAVSRATEAPVEDLLVSLASLPVLSGRVHVADPTNFEVTWRWKDAHGPTRTTRIPLDALGRFSRPVQATATGSLYVASKTNNRMAYLADVSSASSPLHVIVTNGQEIAGIVENLPEADDRGRVWLRGPVSKPVQLGQDGAFRIRALPSGTYSVSYSGGPGTHIMSDPVEVSSGTTDVVLRARER